MNSRALILLGRLTATVSFLVGSIILGLFYQTSSSDYLFAGYLFILFGGLINIGVLIFILTRAKKDLANRKALIHTGRLMLINIPIMLVYTWFGSVLLNTMRITFTNSLQSELTDIRIIGCGGGQIDKLEVGESKTVWVKITGDCSLKVNYLITGQRNDESVAGYISGSMGQKASHRIDGQNKELLL